MDRVSSISVRVDRAYLQLRAPLTLGRVHVSTALGVPEAQIPITLPPLYGYDTSDTVTLCTQDPDVLEALATLLLEAARTARGLMEQERREEVGVRGER